MVEFLVAPTERAPITDLGPTDPEPETLGVDVLWEGLGGKWGVQRKALPDLIASVRDGRLGQELVQMGGLVQGIVVVEGRPTWTQDGILLSERNWTIRQHRGVLMSIQSAGVWYLHSSSPEDTCEMVRSISERSLKDRPSSLLSGKGTPARDEWGLTNNRSYAIRFLSCIPSISTVLAARIYDHFGRVPMRWDVSEEQLRMVKGIGKGRAKELMEMLETSDQVEQEAPEGGTG